MKNLLWLTLFFLSCIDDKSSIYNDAQMEAAKTVEFINQHNQEKLKDCTVNYLITNIWPYKIWYIQCPNSVTTTVRKQPSGKSSYDVPVIVDDAQPD